MRFLGGTTRILRLLRQKGVVEDDSVNADEALADKEPALAELAVASTLGRVPAGPALRQMDLSFAKTRSRADPERIEQAMGAVSSSVLGHREQTSSMTNAVRIGDGHRSR